MSQGASATIACSPCFAMRAGHPAPVWPTLLVEAFFRRVQVMPWVLRDQEVNAVLCLPGNERCEYHIKKSVDQGELWSLKGSHGWVLLADEEDRELVPVWPHRFYAEQYASAQGLSDRPEPISIDVWLDRWVPGMTKDGRGIAVFPTPHHRGVVMTPHDLAVAMRSALEEYDE